MELSTHRPLPPRIRVISTPVPCVRLLRAVEHRLQALYDDLVNEPVPQPMVDLVRRHEEAANQGGLHNGTDGQDPADRARRRGRH
jgi:hypothetical protein